METTHFILNVLGWVFLLTSWIIDYLFNKKKEIGLFRMQLAINILALVCFGANLILKFL
jgi:hypothetical protein